MVVVCQELHLRRCFDVQKLELKVQTKHCSVKPEK